MGNPAAYLAELCRKNPLLNSVAQYCYLNIARSPAWWEKQSADREPVRYPADGPVHPVKTAFICDEMTWIDLGPQCESIFLWPGSWRQQMDAFQPDLFFCESTWSGIPPMDGCWRGRIYRNRSVYFENRKTLLKILQYCREKGITTVFWNKEDPLISVSSRYDFLDTALRFDHVFTTAEESVSLYHAIGEERVHVLPFMVNAAVFYPPEQPPEEDRRILFAGSWYQDQEKRCRDMQKLFHYVLREGMQLEIYDRHSDGGESRFLFPEEFSEYLHPAVPTDHVPDLMRQYAWAINVNTITSSRTMFSRRALYLAASGVRILSNPSPGMEAALGGRRINLDETTEALLIDADPEVVRSRFSANAAFQSILDRIELPAPVGAEPVYAL